MLLALLIAGGGAAAQAPPSPGSAPTVERHRIGLFLTGLHGFDVARGTFGATFWVWAVGPDAGRVLRTMDFANADSLSVRLENVVPAGPAGSWGQRRVTGTFRDPWDLRRYPFDRHRLRIDLEEGFEETDGIVYEADTETSGFDLREDVLEGWRLVGMTVETFTRAYPTAFGAPAAAGQAAATSVFTGVRATLQLQRTDWTGFAKLTAALYAAFLLCALGCRVPVNNVSFSPRITFMVASLFAIVINMRAASAALGSEHGLTLIDGLHVAGLAYVVAIAAATVAVRRRQERVDAGQGDAASLARYDHRLCGLAAAGFVLANLALLLGAWAVP